MFLIAYYILTLIPFAAVIVYAGRKVSKLCTTSTNDNAYLLFTYFSLTAWILGALQYAILLASLLGSSPSDFFPDTGLWLGFIQNALWAGAVLSLHSKQLSRISNSLSRFKIFLIVPIIIGFALLTYRTVVVTSEIFTLIDGVFTASIFMVLAVWIVQWRLSHKLAAVFFIYGYSQFIWSTLWFTPFSGPQFGILIASPLWRMAVLFAWLTLISEIAQSGQVSRAEVVEDNESLALPDEPGIVPAESATESSPRGISFIANPILMTIFSVLLTIMLRILVIETLPGLAARWDVWWATTIGTLIVALIGRGFFLFRMHNQKFYGGTEICAALLIIWFNLAKLQKAPDVPSLIALLTAAYLIVRGFINWEEGKRSGSSNYS